MGTTVADRTVRGAPRSRRGGRSAAALLALGIACCSSPTNAPASDAPDLARRITTTVERVMNERRVPGAVVGLAVGQRWSVQHAFGWRDLEQHVPMTVDTLFPVGSITKPITTAALATLIERGQLSWETPLQDALAATPPLPDAAGALTLRQLAAHTSGLPMQPENWTPPERAGPAAAATPGAAAYTGSDLLAALRKVALAPAAANRCNYSNFGSALLGLVVERASGRSFGDALAELVFAPIGMGESGVDPDAAAAARMTRGYAWGERRLVAQERRSFGDLAAVGGVYSSASDLLRFCAAQQDGGPWRRETLADLHRPIAKVPGFTGRVATTGWFLEQIPGFGPLLAHVGEIDGVSSCVALDLETGTALVVLANSDGNAAELIARALMQQLARSDGTWRL